MPYKNYQDHLAAQRRWNARNPDKVRAKIARRRVAKAGGRHKPTFCYVCDDGEGKIVFDHCHKTGTFRGWICWRCNIILGHAKDQPHILRALAHYLEVTDGGKAFEIYGSVCQPSTEAM